MDANIWLSYYNYKEARMYPIKIRLSTTIHVINTMDPTNRIRIE